MADAYETITDDMRRFIAAQHVFFVATAPSGSEGRVNLSPKGLDTLRVLDLRTVAYLDFVGSGVETIAHLRDNGRIVVMFCAFAGPPKIVRLHGRAEPVEPGDPRFESLCALFPAQSGVRSVIRVEVERTSESCGYGVPLYEYQGERTALGAWAAKKGAEGLEQYQRTRNAESIDGLPGLRWVRDGER
ncbi:MAG TPA: pyridoxamine 5'-phosphate oxidase family protein [Myxococcota bacterium]|nr:pyridoxamine 5'-phosphate oxidase family protein [Myxococcota bacterium]